MARTTKRGTCELCGASSNVGTNHGSKVCTNCTHIQSALNKRVEVVAKAARAMHKTEELLGHLIPAGGLAVKVTADLLQEISGIVGYQGEDPAELVEAVRRRVLTCASCDSEDVLREIREIVGYTPEQGDKGLADAVRAFEARMPVGAPDCGKCDAAEALLEIAELVGKRGASSGLVVQAVRESVETAATLSLTGAFLRSDLLRACGLEMDDTEGGEGWDVAAAAAIQAIADLLNRQYEMSAIILRDHEAISNLNNKITRLNGQTHSEREQVTALRSDLSRSSEVIEQLRAELQERNREDAPAAPCASTTYLLDIALRALRGDALRGEVVAGLIEAARSAA